MHSTRVQVLEACTFKVCISPTNADLPCFLSLNHFPRLKHDILGHRYIPKDFVVLQATHLDVSKARLRLRLTRSAEMLSTESRSNADFTHKTKELMRCMQLVNTAVNDLISQSERITTWVDILLKFVRYSNTHMMLIVLQLYSHMQQ